MFGRIIGGGIIVPGQVDPLAQQIESLGPTHYWKMDDASGDFADSSGSNTLLALPGTGSIQYQQTGMDGETGNAAIFSGDGGSHAASENTVQMHNNFGNHTVVMFVKTLRTGSFGSVYEYRDLENFGTPDRERTQIDNTPVDSGFHNGSVGGTSSYNGGIPNSDGWFATGTWFMYAVARSINIQEWYRNKVRESSSIPTGQDSAANHTIGLAASFSGGTGDVTSEANIAVQHYAIWHNTRLSAAQLGSIYDASPLAS